MKAADEKHYLPEQEYDEAIEELCMCATVILYSFGTHSTETRDLIIRSFIARGTTALKSILLLWKTDHYHDCWILYRSLVDRLFHLRALADNDDFLLFDDWSFVKQYEYRNRAKSDPDFKDTLNTELVKETLEEKERYQEIKKLPPKWKRPLPEEVANKMGLGFLYKYAYDYASAHVHPMANDGDEDFGRLTGLTKRDMPPDRRVILNNSCLILVLLIQEGLNTGTLQWRRVVYDFLDHFMHRLAGESEQYRVALFKFIKMSEERGLCQKRSSG